MMGEAVMYERGKQLFEVKTPLGFRVRTSHSYWQRIITLKHPVMKGSIARVKKALRNPDQVRRSRSDPAVYLFYKRRSEKRWTCAVAKQLNGEGFLITTYPTDAVKEGEQVWPR